MGHGHDHSPSLTGMTVSALGIYHVLMIFTESRGLSSINIRIINPVLWLFKVTILLPKPSSLSLEIRS